MRIVVLPEVRRYLNELTHILYTQDYFGFMESALEYVEDLFLDVEKNLPTCAQKKAPPYFDRYGKGMYYAVFRKNRRTHWYVFFTLYHLDDETVYLIRHIDNNHRVAHLL